MIKFFRTLRSRLLDEKDLKGYFKYAAGEIVLVVVGILIAISINDWNIDNKTDQQQKRLIEQVLLDLEQSKKDMADAVEYYQRRTKAAASVSQSFWNRLPAGDSLLINLFIPFSYTRFKPNLSTINSLIYSGDLKLTRSIRVRSTISTYFEIVNSKIEDIQRFEEQYYRTGVDLIKANMDPVILVAGYNKLDLFVRLRVDFAITPFPEQFSEIPFPTKVEDIYGNKEIYQGYNYLLISFRNTSRLYNEILEETQKLAQLLREEGY